MASRVRVPDEQWAELLVDLGLAVRQRLLDAFADPEFDAARMEGREGGDEIFAIDREAEPAIEEAIEGWPDETQPLRLIAEGMGEEGRTHFGSKRHAPRYTVIIDPIDGTRCLMYQKRSAWFVAAVAENREDGEPVALADTRVALLTELPVTKQGLVDTYLGVRSRGYSVSRSALDGSGATLLPVAPSTATTLLHGHAHVANFFPGVKRLAADLIERIVDATLPEREASHALIYDDQYPATAGQMVELIRGSDRFTCDLRPLFNRILAREDPDYRPVHTCHPYDCGGALVAREAGVVLTNGRGGTFDGPLDVHTPMDWCGYANKALRARIEPVIRTWLAEHGIMD